MQKTHRRISARPQHGRSRIGLAIFAAFAGAALVLSACAATGSAPTSESPLLPKGNYAASDEQQSATCEGIPAVPADQLRLLGPKTHIASAVVCITASRYLPGKGLWNVAEMTPVQADKLPSLVAALTTPDAVAGSSSACTAMLVIVPGFVLSLPDGTRIRPGVPGDGCHPQGTVVDVLVSLTQANAAATQTTPVTQLATELQVTTGCDGESKPPWVWLNTDRPGTFSVPADVQVSVCRYKPTVDGGHQTEQSGGGFAIEMGTLSHVGVVPAAKVNGLLDAGDTLVPGCRPSGDTNEAPNGDWLYIVVTPTKPYPPNNFPEVTVVALVELNGCQRLIAPSTSTIGYLDAQQTAALATLADSPAS